MSTVRELHADALIDLPLPDNSDVTDKDSRGQVLLIGGSSTSPGAVLLSGVAALRGGAGKVLVAAVETDARSLAFMAPEFGIAALRSTTSGEPDNADDRLDAHFEHCDAVLVGPGMTDAQNARAFTLKALDKTRVPLVIDAAAITAFSKDWEVLHRFQSRRIFTPHAGEMAKLLDIPKKDVQRIPEQLARRSARDMASIIVLKGETTYIADANGEIWRHRGGVCGLATAGSGDTLAGLIAALLARGASPMCACLWSVLVHAEAGKILTESVGAVGFLARELPALFPRVMRGFSGQP